MSALRTLLEGVVDYAGLFPPAGLDMRTAVASFAEYRRSSEAWMLGRFIVPVSRLEEFDAALAATREADAGWILSALAGDDLAGDAERVEVFNARAPEGRRVDTIEAKLSARRDIESAGAVARGGWNVFAEIPVQDDPADLVSAIAKAEISAKIRTGGVTPDAFPSANDIVRFMSRCIRAGVTFKATAGLHHPISGEHPLANAPGAPRSMMFGYLNVLLAAALIRDRASATEAVELLIQRDGGAFRATSDAILWRTFEFSTRRLAELRERAAVSFGSCSFREPVDELRELGFVA